ncbi:MAG: hypothetical protein ABSE05_12660 [Syntrophales bacterium]|jgi:hydroxylamine reductase (hybrid-cluster protein)
MFCYQCEQTAKGEACTKAGVCGKQADLAASVMTGCTCTVSPISFPVISRGRCVH